MANSNQRVRLNSAASPVTVDPETVQNLINEFFNFNDTAEEIEKTLWEMFRDSISNPELPSGPNENSNRAFLYRALSGLVGELEKYKGKTYIDLPEN
jgi:hypothetical protein